MAIINQRWPRDLCPESCVFGRQRNDVRQISPRSQKPTIIRQGGRPLYSAECTWRLPNTKRLAKLRYWLEQLDGFNGSVQLWDFGNPYPYGLELATGPSGLGEIRTSWTYLGNDSLWTLGGIPTHWTIAAPVTLASSASLGATSLSLTGLDASKVTTIQGQYVQVGRRLYLAASDVDSSGAGTATISLQSPLLAAASSGATVRLAEAACEMQLAEQSIDARTAASDGLTIVTAKFIESVEDVV